jgi:hypothetical protein
MLIEIFRGVAYFSVLAFKKYFYGNSNVADEVMIEIVSVNLLRLNEKIII